MKSERRHELQRNALAEWIVNAAESVKPYANSILIGVIVVMLGILAYTWMSGSSSGREATAWDAVFLAMNTGNTSELERTVEQYPNTTAAQWATVVAGDLYLQAGCEELFTTKATAADELQRAQEKYKLVLETAREPVLRERATYGLARTYEAMAGTRQSQGDLNLAVQHYEEVATKWPQGAYADASARRAAALKQLSTKKFYDAFAAWEPRPAFSAPEGLDGLNLPFDDSGLMEGEQPQDFFGDLMKGLDEKVGAAEQSQASADATSEGDQAASAEPQVLQEPPAAESVEPEAADGSR